MGYSEDLERLLAKIELYESLKGVGRPKPTEIVNKVLERLNTDEWRVSIDSHFHWVVAIGEPAISARRELRIEPLKDLKATLMDVISYALPLLTQPHEYSSIKEFEEKVVNAAIELVDKIDESLYEDLMSSVRESQRDTKLIEYNKVLQQVVPTIAEEWLKENLAPGIVVSLRNPDGFSVSNWKVKKLVKVGGAIALALEGTDHIVTDLRELDILECWKNNTSEAVDIIRKLFSEE